MSRTLLTWDDIAHLIGRGTYKIPSSNDVPNLAVGSGGGWTDGGTTVYLTTATDQVTVGTNGTALTGRRFTVVDDGANTGVGITALGAGTTALAAQVSGDTVDRINVTASGAISWSSGAVAADTGLARLAASTLAFTGATLSPVTDNAALGSTTNRWAVYAGDYAANITNVSAAYAVTAGDNVVAADTSGGSFTVTLPDIATNRQRQVTVTKLDATNTLTIAGAGADTIQGGATSSLTAISTLTYAAPETGTDWILVGSAGGAVTASGWTDGGAEVYLTTSTDQVTVGASGTALASRKLSVITTGANQGIGIQGAATTDNAIAALVSGDALPRFQALASGALVFGSGTLQDVRLLRTSADTIQFDNNAGGGATLVPAADNTGSIGTNALRFNTVRAVNLIGGDIGFTDTECPVCKAGFAVGEDVLFRVRVVEAETTGPVTYTIPIHFRCVGGS